MEVYVTVKYYREKKIQTNIHKRLKFNATITGKRLSASVILTCYVAVTKINQKYKDITMLCSTC